VVCLGGFAYAVGAVDLADVFVSCDYPFGPVFVCLGGGAVVAFPHVTLPRYSVSMRLVLFGVVLVLAGCSTVSTAEPEVVPTPTVTETPVVDYSDLASEIGGSNSWEVGVEIQPGPYMEQFDNGMCEWYKGRDGELLSWGEGAYVTLEVGETIEMSGCSVWVLLD